MLTLMAGGDFDGDLVCVSWWDKLIALVDLVAAAVDAYAWEGLQHSVDSELPAPQGMQLTQEGNLLGSEYTAWALQQATPAVRGRTCALAERGCTVLMQMINQGVPFGDALKATMILILISHKSMDVPKKCTADGVSRLARSWFRQLTTDRAGIARLPVTIADELRFDIPDWSYQAPARAFKAELNNALGDVAIGQVWVPSGLVFLGSSAGARLGECLNEDSQPADGDVIEEASMAHEMAHFFYNKLQPHVKSVAGLSRADPEMVLRWCQAARCTAPKTLGQLGNSHLR